MRFIDTNVFLRHLLNDHADQSPACYALIRAIERGEEEAWTSDLVIAELVFVLSSRNLYCLPRERIRDLLLPLIRLPGLKLSPKRLYDRIFEIYVDTSVDYIDACHAARVEQRVPPELWSYDADFDRVEGAVRVEPPPPEPGDAPA